MIKFRSQKIVNRKLQYQVLFVVSGCGIVVVLIAVICLRVLSNQFLELLENSNIDSQVAFLITENLQQTSVYLYTLMIFALILSWVAGLYLSNRIAGPVFNISRVLDRHFSGENNLKIKVRDNDFFIDIVEKINRLLEQVQKEKNSKP